MLVDISLLWSLIHILIIFIFLYESRYSLRTTCIATAICMGALIVVNMAGLVLFGVAMMGKLIILTCTIPSLIFFFIMAKERNGKFLFTFCLADTVSAGILVATNLLDHYLGGGEHILLFVGRLVAFPLLEYAVWRWLRRPYREVQQALPKGWGIFALMSVIFYLLMAVMSSWPAPILERPEDIPAMVLILLLMPLTYATIFGTLHLQMTSYRQAQQQQIFASQSSMIAQRAQLLRESEEKLRIERHDLRHRLQAVALMIERDEKAEALAYIGASQAQLDEAKPVRYCQNAVLNAILAAYFSQAQEAGITVETKLAIPEELPVDASELSVVFANALENAIHACSALPEGQRRIICRCVNSPRFIFEIANTCTGETAFDRDGLPIATEAGHGLGTRSIAAFVEKHQAICSYRQEDGWFRLQIGL